LRSILSLCISEFFLSKKEEKKPTKNKKQQQQQHNNNNKKKQQQLLLKQRIKTLFLHTTLFQIHSEYYFDQHLGPYSETILNLNLDLKSQKVSSSNAGGDLR
jgi:hypothetical protein